MRALKRFGSKKSSYMKRLQPAQPARFVSSDGYYHEQILVHADSLECKHPNDEDWLRREIILLCGKRLSTAAVPLLEGLYAKTSDVFCRKLLARKIHALRQDYLNSFKEYSDRRLLMLLDRDNFFDKWEGVYILGRFGKGEALQRLQELAAGEKDPAMQHALIAAARRIEKKRKEKKRQRGF